MNDHPILHLLWMGLVAIITAGCASVGPVESDGGTVAGTDPTYALIYVIHGDGDYLYHMDGKRKHADQEALTIAQKVGRSAAHAEVFIFHQRPSRRLFGLFRQPTNGFYHYRRGELVGKGRYVRDPSSMSAEADIYMSRRNASVKGTSFLYYAHDIPEQPSTRYHTSYPRTSFSIDSFSASLARFRSGGDPFDLIVLSTCNNASPRIAAALSHHTKFLLASPGDLHLSHIDSHPMHLAGAEDVEIEGLAHRTAEWAFKRLVDRTRTNVSLTLFNMDALSAYLPDLTRTYAATRNGSQVRTIEDFVDCRDVPGLDLPDDNGLKRWYRPPSFGRESRKTDHSGWGCPASLTISPRGETAELVP